MLAENPKVTELKPYKGFRIFKYQLFSEWSSRVWYEAFFSRYGEVEEYVDDCYTLKECKQKIDFIINDRLFER